MRSVGKPDDFRTRVDVIGRDQVIQGWVLGKKLVGEFDRLVARASGLANLDGDSKLRRRGQHRGVDRVPELGRSRRIDEPDPEISAPRRGRPHQQEDDRGENPHHLKQDALLSVKTANHGNWGKDSMRGDSLPRGRRIVNTGAKSPGEELMTCNTSAVPIFLCGALVTLGKL